MSARVSSELVTDRCASACWPVVARRRGHRSTSSGAGRGAAGEFAMRVVDTLVDPGEFVFDIGGAWRLYAKRFAPLVGRAGSV